MKNAVHMLCTIFHITALYSVRCDNDSGLSCFALCIYIVDTKRKCFLLHFSTTQTYC